jgi:lysophospholipase L1-like esterase
LLNELKKVWEGNTVYAEPVCFLNSNKDCVVSRELLYVPSKILRVETADGSHIFEEGKDYIVQGKKILRTGNSTMPVLSKDDYIVPFTGEQDTEWLRLLDGENYVKIFPDIIQYQVLVTYLHDQVWEGFVPENVTALLPRTMKILAQKEHLSLVFYGDSITAGWEASGCDEYAIDMNSLEEFHNSCHRPPYMPAWVSLVSNTIIEHYDNHDITKVNRGAGGSTSLWGCTNAATLVNPHKPDLSVIAFGMNNLQDEPEKFEQEITEIITTIRSENPYCEFLLVSAMTPYTEIKALADNKLAQHQEALFRIQKSMSGVAVAPVNSMFRELYHHGKQHFDITGNCINHPNDFSIRIYAQTILAALGI